MVRVRVGFRVMLGWVLYRFIVQIRVSDYEASKVKEVAAQRLE